MTVVEFVHKNLCERVDVDGVTFTQLLEKLKLLFKTEVASLDLNYIDCDKDYITLKEQEDWEVYMEDLPNLPTGVPGLAGKVFLFDSLDKDNASVFQDMVDHSVEASFHRLNSLNNSVASLESKSTRTIIVDPLIKEEIGMTLAMNSQIMSPGIRSNLAEMEPSAFKESHYQIIDEEVNRIVQQKIDSKELELVQRVGQKEVTSEFDFRLVDNVADMEPADEMVFKKPEEQCVFVKFRNDIRENFENNRSNFSRKMHKFNKRIVKHTKKIIKGIGKLFKKLFK